MAGSVAMAAARDHQVSPSPANPSQEDGLVRGLSESIGGPLGDHTSRRSATLDRSITPARIVIALALVVFGLHWLQKSPCQDGAWANFEQYTKFCYTDVLALYYAEHLNEGAVPYFDHPVEYPVLTGLLMGTIGLPVGDFVRDHPNVVPVQLFYNLNALVLIAFGLGAIGAVLALRRRRPWDAAMFALSPALLVTATVNWDLFAIGLTTFALYAWSRRRPVVAGILFGLATAAKFYPMLLIGAILVLALRSGRWRPFLATVGSGLATWVVVNGPVFLWANDGWDRFWQLSSERAIDWGTLWYVLRYVETDIIGADSGPIAWLNGHISVLNTLSQVLLVLCCVGILALTLSAPRRPRLAQLCFLVVAVFLLTSKVWSQQFVLWLIPLAVLARPRWGAFLLWQAAEIGYFLAFYGELLGASGKPVIPEGLFVFAAALRWVTVAILVGFVVRDILQPERDVVRRSYSDDPDGGPFDEAPDVLSRATWRDRHWRELRRSPARSQ
jgi:uncharacterized membrane protein